jgi:hypothetical protein
LGNYEKIDPETDCPEARYIGGSYIGYPISEIGEVSFSKSISACILGGKGSCWNDQDCVLDIYETSQPPDVDISDCDGGDFRILEEVRYRRDVPVERILRVFLDKALVNQILSMYHEDGVATVELEILKENIATQLAEAKKRGDFKRGSVKLYAMSEKELNESFAKEMGMTLEELEWHLKEAPRFDE